MNVLATGVAASLGAAVTTTTLAALARSAGVDFEVPDGGESIPVAGFATVTAAFSFVGVGLALALARWSDRPATRFVRVTLPLAAASLVPPLAVGAAAGTAATLVGLHVVAAGIVIPTLARCLRGRSH